VISSDKKQYYLDVFGFISIGLLSYVYFIHPKFAEEHLQLFFLNFPIFVGEILLFVCLILFLIRYRNNLKNLNRWHYVIICYFGFILIKALFGYIKWGPLALRHSALLYYPVFTIFSYAFYRRELFDWKACGLLLLLICYIFFTGDFVAYWIFTLVALGIILIKSFPPIPRIRELINPKLIKSLMFLVFFYALIFFNYGDCVHKHYNITKFFATSRTMIVGNFMVGIYNKLIIAINRMPSSQKVLFCKRHS